MKIAPQLIPRAVLVRLRSLDLGGINDYYASSAAESSSTLVASAPQSNNTYIIAYGDKEGLAPGERLEMYGRSVRLVRTMAYGCPRGVTPESILYGAIGSENVKEITRQLDRMAAIYHELDLHGTRRTGGSAKADPTRKKGAVESSVAEEQMWWTVVRQAGPEPLARDAKATAVARDAVPGKQDTGGELADPPPVPPLSPQELQRRLRQLRRSNREVVAAEWRRVPSEPSLITPMNGEAEDDLLVENGVCFSRPEQAGLRVLRAARLAFMSMIERKANWLREAQMRKRGVNEEPQPLAVLDVSGIDFSFSHAAVQSTVELGLHDEAQCYISFIPLNNAAAQRAEGAMAAFVRQAVRAPGVAHDDPFALVSVRSFDVAAYTAYLDLPPPPDKAQQEQQSGNPNGADGRRVSSRQTYKASLQLARALSALRSGCSMLVSFVPTPRSVAAMHAAVCHSRRAEVAMEGSTVAEAKACVAAAISRSGRWGYITDEVLPMVDCPQGSGVSLVVTVL